MIRRASTGPIPGRASSSAEDGAQLDPAGPVRRTDRLDSPIADQFQQAQVMSRGVRGVAGQEEPRPELADHRRHPAVMVGVVMADDHQVEGRDPPGLEQLDDVAGRAGVDQGRFLLR